MGVTFINIPHTQHVITGVTNSLIKHSERVEVAQKASGGIPCGSCGVALTHNVSELYFVQLKTKWRVCMEYSEC